MPVFMVGVVLKMNPGIVLCPVLEKPLSNSNYLGARLKAFQLCVRTVIFSRHA